MSILLSLTSAQLNRAADLKDKISALEIQLASILGAAPASPGPERRSGMSPAARARIAAAQRARWARVKGKKPAAKAVKTSGRRRRMSASVKARLSALAKARWARVKAAGKRAL